MASATFAAFVALMSSFSAIDLLPILLELHSTQTATTFDDTTVHLFLTVTATVALFAAIVVIHLHHAGAAAAGTPNRRLSEIVLFTLCIAVGTLLFFLIVLPAGDVNDDLGALLARALGRAAVDALPVSAAVEFFLGISLVIAHIRAGGEGGGGAAAADRGVPALPVDVLKEAALGGAAALLGQIAIAALYLK